MRSHTVQEPRTGYSPHRPPIPHQVHVVLHEDKEVGQKRGVERVGEAEGVGGQAEGAERRVFKDYEDAAERPDLQDGFAAGRVRVRQESGAEHETGYGDDED